MTNTIFCAQEVCRASYVDNPMKGAVEPGPFARHQTEAVWRFHHALPAYAETPLVSLPALARAGGISAVLVKDESKRFGLKAFKGLGGVYAMFRMLCCELGLDPAATSPEDLSREPYASAVRNMTFVTTTDGNHGKGVSWAASYFGCRAHVFLPEGTVEARAQAIRDAGNATATITNLSYDACTAYTAELARTNGWLLIQDNSWPGYEEVPLWIMQGYTTLVREALDQAKALGFPCVTHVFLQAGVGAMAGAVALSLIDAQPENPLVVALAEPEDVACFYASMQANDELPHAVPGGETIMAGLNCATPCTLAWEGLKRASDGCFACSDAVAERGMRLLAHPLPGDTPIVSGESGAVTAGLLDCLLREPSFAPQRKALRLHRDAVVLLINTEGDTDPAHYQAVTGLDVPERRCQAD